MQVIGTEILSNVLYLIAQSLFIPVIIIVLIFITYAILSLGGFITEKFSRTKFSVKKTEKLIRSISKSSEPEEMKEKVRESELPDNSKDVLITIISNYDIGSKSRKAIANKLIEEQELQFSSTTQKTDTLVRLAPTVGLLGTLIPLGPGLSALGNGDLNTLAQALTVAFDTTITGLAAGSIAYIISGYRKKWYNNELSILEAIVEATLEALDNVKKKTVFR